MCSSISRANGIVHVDLVVANHYLWNNSSVKHNIFNRFLFPRPGCHYLGMHPGRHSSVHLHPHVHLLHRGVLLLLLPATWRALQGTRGWVRNNYLRGGHRGSVSVERIENISLHITPNTFHTLIFLVFLINCNIYYIYIYIYMLFCFNFVLSM